MSEKVNYPFPAEEKKQLLKSVKKNAIIEKKDDKITLVYCKFGNTVFYSEYGKEATELMEASPNFYDTVISMCCENITNEIFDQKIKK